MQRPLARMFKTAFLPVLWVCIFRDQRDASYTWQEVYKWTLRVRCESQNGLFVNGPFVAVIAPEFGEQASCPGSLLQHLSRGEGFDGPSHQPQRRASIPWLPHGCLAIRHLKFKP
jgi:hypothetical protein